MGKYAAKCKGQRPKWYRQSQATEQKPSDRYPDVQPHPCTKAHAPSWGDEIQAIGPVGLLISAAVRNGLVIDNDLKIWQRNEEPIDLLNTPYQSLRPQLLMMAARARTLGEWERKHHLNTFTRGLREIDKEASQLNLTLPEKEQVTIRTAVVGGSIAKQEIAKSPSPTKMSTTPASTPKKRTPRSTISGGSSNISSHNDGNLTPSLRQYP